MNCSCAAVELSVVFPLYNEESALPDLFHLLEQQLQGCFELIFSDGASTDGTLKLLEDYRQCSRHRVEIVSGPRGRGRQMNRGARLAQAEALLFLHADSRWEDSAVLVRALRFFNEQRQAKGQLCAGHFPLRFVGTGDCARVFRYLAAKSALNIPGTVYGDQGMLLLRRDWQQLGGFPEELPVLEDVDLAERIWCQGGWVLLPGELTTSNRRYRADGVWWRQWHNAALLVVRGGGQAGLLQPLLASYRVSSSTEAEGSFKAFCRQLHRLSLLRYGQFWYGCGHTLSCYFWLAPYALSWLLGAEEQGSRRVLAVYQRRVAPWMVSTPVATALALVGWLFFYLSYLCRPDCWSWQFLRLTPSEHKRRTP